ncbi:hypothetical protein Scep_019211 [Stephania cephalantha]|uniref:Integrase zinc-binding domain-containing protein n=1 Tax=Stephania cephalantha TaxID=152367 RepID=A0AAP0IAX2_9MAGN
MVMYNGCIYVPPQFAFQSVHLQEFHNTLIGGYTRIQRTYSHIAAIFFLPNLRKSVMAFVRTCVTCQQVKPFNKHPQGLLQPFTILGKT